MLKQALTTAAPPLALLRGGTAVRHSGLRRAATAFSRNFSKMGFIVCVVLPTILSGWYFAFVASDQYVAEVRFTLKSPEIRATNVSTYEVAPSSSDAGASKEAGNKGAAATSSALGALTSIASGILGRDSNNEELFVVVNYLRSRNVVQKLEKDGYLRRVFSRPEIDYFSRFRPESSDERLWHYWRSKITPSIDNLSGVVTLQVIAFNPEDALELARRLTAIGEEVVNDYSLHIRENTLRNAEIDLRNANENYREALNSVKESRESSRVVDPVQDITATIKELAEVQLQRLRLEAERNARARLSSSSGLSVQLFERRIAALDDQIKQLQAKLTATQENIQASTAVLQQFEEKELNRMFAQTLLSVRQSAYQQARLDAERQQLYLVAFSKPSLPQEPRFPRRIVNFVLLALGSLLIWSTLRLLTAGVRDQAY